MGTKILREHGGREGTLISLSPENAELSETYNYHRPRSAAFQGFVGKSRYLIWQFKSGTMAENCTPSTPGEYLTTLIRSAIACGAKHMAFTRATGATRVEFRSGEGPPIREGNLPPELEQGFAEALLLRAAYWPDAKEISVNTGRKKRILACPAMGERWMADLSRKGERYIALENITTAGVDFLLDTLCLQPRDREAISSCAERTSGLVLANTDPKTQGADGLAISLALYPEADVYFADNLPQAIAAAEHHVAIVARPEKNVVEGIFNVLGKISGEAAERFAKHLFLSVAHTTVRRVCDACARSTVVDPKTIEKLPTLLAPMPSTTYLFGRGCDACGLTAYRGTISLASVCVITDELRPLITTAIGVETAQLQFTACAYRGGTRLLLEDGLAKIFSGMTSFEEVLSSAGSVLPPAFAAAIAQQAKQPSAAAEVRPLRPRILIVEDDFDQRGVLEMIFRSEGYDVTAVENGKRALQLLESTAVDIVLCDFMMPELSGDRVVERIRANPKLSHLPVLMLTAAHSPDAEYTSLDKGADDYCAKSVKKKVLLKRVERLLRRKGTSPLDHMMVD